jgi:hypothetical protein
MTDEMKIATVAALFLVVAAGWMFYLTSTCKRSSMDGACGHLNAAETFLEEHAPSPWNGK